jgi:hypothetical protein
MKQWKHPREVFPDNQGTLTQAGTQNPAVGPSRGPDYEQGYERLSALRLATSATPNHQYLFANVVEIEPIEKDLFAEIVNQASDRDYVMQDKAMWWWSRD